jgi:hypothetical protein
MQTIIIAAILMALGTHLAWAHASLRRAPCPVRVRARRDLIRGKRLPPDIG